MRWLALWLAACSPDLAPPALSVVEPPSAARGAHIKVTGSGMCGGEAACKPADVQIELGDARTRATNVTTTTDTEALFDVPPTATQGPSYIVVTFDGRESNHLAFMVQ